MSPWLPARTAWCRISGRRRLSVGLIAWGVKDRRELLVNLGIAGFALTVTIYYFSDVMDRLGRSASLIGMGLLFLGGGYLLERTRRGLLVQAPGGTVSRRGAGIALAIVHVALVGMLGLKLLADRAQLPRAWARTLPYDPSLPIRGRYVRLRLEVPLDSASAPTGRGVGRAPGWRRGTDDFGGCRIECRQITVTIDSIQGTARAALIRPIAFFIPEHVPDPSVRERRRGALGGGDDSPPRSAATDPARGSEGRRHHASRPPLTSEPLGARMMPTWADGASAIVRHVSRLSRAASFRHTAGLRRAARRPRARCSASGRGTVAGLQLWRTGRPAVARRTRSRGPASPV